MAKINLKINIPDWLYRYRWQNVKNYLTYQIKPYRCVECKVKLPFSSFDINCDAKYPLKRRLAIKFHADKYVKECICPSCLLKKVNATVALPNYAKIQRGKYNDYNVKKECAVCGEKKPAFMTFHFTTDSWGARLHYCTTSWNHDHVCLECTQTALQFGEMQSGWMSAHQGKRVYLNGLKLPVVNGKVCFPFK
jgi:hypothetical protein